MRKKILICFVFLTASTSLLADTFTNRMTQEVLHGFATCKQNMSDTTVCTQEKGIIRLNLSEYDVEYNAIGRKNVVSLIKITKAPIASTEKDAIEKTLKDAVNRGYMMVIFELDASGGDRFVIKEICSSITSLNSIPMIAFVNNKENKGAFADCMAIALACDKIYISPDASIGCAEDKYDEEKKKKIDQNTDLREMFGEVVGEKFTSAYRGYIHALAQRNNRPQLLASAMMDKNIDVLEVTNAQGETEFIQEINKLKTHNVVKTWSTKGNLLQLSAKDAIETGMADKNTQSIECILNDYCIRDAQIQEVTEHVEIRASYEQAKDELDKVMDQIKNKYEQLNSASSNKEKAAILSTLIRFFMKVLYISEQHPEFGIKPDYIKVRVNAMKADIAELRGR